MGLIKTRKYSALRIVAGVLFALLWLMLVLMILTGIGNGWVMTALAVACGFVSAANFRGARTGERVDWDSRR